MAAKASETLLMIPFRHWKTSSLEIYCCIGGFIALYSSNGYHDHTSLSSNSCYDAARLENATFLFANYGR